MKALTYPRVITITDYHQQAQKEKLGSKLLFWLLSSILLLVVSLITSTVMYLCGKLNANCSSGGFRSRLGRPRFLQTCKAALSAMVPLYKPLFAIHGSNKAVYVNVDIDVVRHGARIL
jgi:hypothetical protein